MRSLLVILAFLLLSSGALLAKGIANLEVNDVYKDTLSNGVKGIMFLTNVKVTHEDGTGTLPAGYRVLLQLTDTDLEPIHAGPGAEVHASPNGLFRSQADIQAGSPNAESQATSLFIPYYALDLPNGTHKLNYLLSVITPEGDTLGNQVKSQVSFYKPSATFFRITLPRINVEGVAPNGLGWDTKLFSTSEMRPELYWQLIQEGAKLFGTEAKYKKNTLQYLGKSPEDRSPWILVSEGDQLWIDVMDYDLTTSDDRLGRIAFDPWKEGHGIITGSTPFVHNAEFKMESRDAPQLLVRDIRTSLQAREDGVSGFSIRFSYSIPSRSPQNRYFLDLDQEMQLDQTILEEAKIVSGPVSREDGRFELVSQKGEVHLFLPYYALKSEDGVSPPVRLQIHGDIETQEYLLYNRTLDIKRNAEDVEDLQFGQFTFGQEAVHGQSGIMLTMDYNIPEDYLRDHPDATFQINADLRADHKSIVMQSTEIAGELSKEEAMNVRTINGRNPKGKIQLFIPYTKLEPGTRITDCGVELECVMLEGETIRTLGSYGVEQEINLPELIGITVRVKEASVRKNILEGGEKPNLRWVLWVGDEMVYASEITYQIFNPEWLPKVRANASVLASDRLRISLVHDPENGKLFEIGTWEGNLNTLPEIGDEFKVSLRGGAKMTIVREAY